MSDKWSGTNENLPGLLKCCLVCLSGPALIDNTVIQLSYFVQ